MRIYTSLGLYSLLLHFTLLAQFSNPLNEIIMKELIFQYVIPIFIVLTGIFLSFKSDILKDSSISPKRPFSFARTQLMWWAIIISSCFCAYYGKNGELVDLNDRSYLILLGISIGTVTAARIIDNTDILNNIVRHQDNNDSKGFIIDIISDDSGISVHRFQAMVFNAIFGAVFIAEYLEKGTFIKFGNLELALMGISSAAYVGMKLNENKQPSTVSEKSKSESSSGLESSNSPKTKSSSNQDNKPQTDDDLIDIDSNYSNNEHLTNKDN